MVRGQPQSRAGWYPSRVAQGSARPSSTFSQSSLGAAAPQHRAPLPTLTLGLAAPHGAHLLLKELQPAQLGCGGMESSHGPHSDSLQPLRCSWAIRRHQDPMVQHMWCRGYQTLHSPAYQSLLGKLSQIPRALPGEAVSTRLSPSASSQQGTRSKKPKVGSHQPTQQLFSCIPP